MGGLSFLSPLYLLGAAAIAVPIVLHLFRRRTDTVIEFPAVRLLAHTPVEQQRRRRLRELVLLALRMAALVLLALAFARPYFADGVLAADTAVTVVALDRSFSMSAPGLFDQARTLAREAIARAPAGHAVALVAFDDAAQVVVAPTADRSVAMAAVAALGPTSGRTRYAAVVSAVTEVLGGRGGEVVVVTDLQRAGWDTPARGALDEDIVLRVMRVEPPLGNLAVTAADRRGTRVEAAIRNFGLERRMAVATLEVDGTERARVDVGVAPRSVATVRFGADVPATGAAAVRITDGTGAAADDVRYLALEQSAAIPVLILVADVAVGDGGLYVERALAAADHGGLFSPTVLDGRGLAAWSPAQLGRQRAVLLLGTRTLDRKGRQLLAGYLAAGGAALATLGPDVDIAALGDVLGTSIDAAPAPQSFADGTGTLVLEDTRHPVLRPFAAPAAALGDVRFDQFRRVSESGWRVLARLSGGAAALLEQPRPRGRLLAFTSDLDNRWNRFPLSPAFVPFMVEAARYLTAADEARQALTPGTAAAGVAPTPGVHVSPPPAEPGHQVAVNVDAAESDPVPMSADEFAGAIPRGPRTGQPDAAAEARTVEDGQRLWQWGLVLMFAALAGEGLIGRRAT